MSQAPKVQSADLDAAIKKVEYVVLPDERTTICMLTLDNDYTVRGESSCVCKENFDAEIGQRIAYANAREKLWPLLGFRLADRLARERMGPRYRDAETGYYVSAEYAAENPTTTVREA